MSSDNLRTIKTVWEISEQEGLDAGIEALINVSSDDVEFRPYLGQGRVLHGPDALRGYWREALAGGGYTRAGAYEFEQEEDGSVVVTGWLRVSSAGGGLADSQVRWTYSFRNGRVVRADAEPLTGA